MGSSDPLEKLGHDVFVNVLSFVGVRDILAAELVCREWNKLVETHSSGLWRRLALISGVEQVDIDACDALSATGKYPLGEYDRRAIANNMYKLLHCVPPDDLELGRAGSTPDAVPGVTPCLEGERINWRYVVQSHYTLQNAWSAARCRVGWVTPKPNVVWRIKSAAEQDVVLTTARMNGPVTQGHEAQGLTVVDRYTSEPLFSLEVQGYSHLEAGRGFFAFNRERPDSSFEVWRNADARARSTLQRIGESAIAMTAVSHSHEDDEFRPGDSQSPLPRGHYEHFRTLAPPTSGRAYRMHVDREGTDSAAAILATCAMNAIYLWHLEEDLPMETIQRGSDDRGSPNYIELDDEYVFVCDDWQMHVYARETHAHVVSFPPLSAPPKDIAALGFPLSITDDFRALPDAERLAFRQQGTQTPEGVPAPVGRALLLGAMPGEDRFEDVIGRSIAMQLPGQGEHVLYSFSACHFTSRDLVCTTGAGGVLVVRNYKEVLAQCARMEEVEPPLDLDEDQATRHIAPAERAAHVANNSMIFGLGTTVKQLTTYRDHIVIATSFNVILLDGRNFPNIPTLGTRFVDCDIDATASRPTIRAHVLLGNHQQAMKHSSCLQADARSIYLVYWATGEVEASPSDAPTAPTHNALDGLGLCVKVWTFGAEA